MKPILCLLLILSVCGCKSTWNNSNKISLGMTKPELIAAIGPPEDSLSPGDNVEVLRYIFVKQRVVRIPPAVPLKKIYLVRLESGRVAAYGTERDLVKSIPRITPTAPKNEKTININVRTEGQGTTNALAPIQPRLDLNEN